MTVDEIYNNIGQSVASAIEHQNWEMAVLDINFEGDGVVGYRTY